MTRPSVPIYLRTILSLQEKRQYSYPHKSIGPAPWRDYLGLFERWHDMEDRFAGVVDFLLNARQRFAIAAKQARRAPSIALDFCGRKRRLWLRRFRSIYRSCSPRCRAYFAR